MRHVRISLARRDLAWPDITLPTFGGQPWSSWSLDGLGLGGLPSLAFGMPSLKSIRMPNLPHLTLPAIDINIPDLGGFNLSGGGFNMPVRPWDANPRPLHFPSLRDARSNPVLTGL